MSGQPDMSINGQTTGRWSIPCLMVGALAIAFSPIFVRLSELDPTATAFHRVFLAMPVLWVWGHWQGSRSSVSRSGPVSRRDSSVPKSPRDSSTPKSHRDYGVLILAGVFFALDLAFWHWSIRLTSVANSTLLSNFAPIFVTLGGYFLFRETFTGTFITGMGVAMMGAVVLMAGSLAFDADHLLGDILGVITAVFYAGYILTVGRLRSRFSTATIMTWSSGSAAVVLLPISILSGDSLIATSAYGWAVLAGLAWLSHTAGQGLIAYALAHLPAAFTSVGLLVQPVAAAFLAWIILGEGVGTWQVAGGIIVLGGIYISRQGSR